MYVDLVQSWSIFSSSSKRQSVFLCQSNLSGRKNPCRDPVSLCHFEGSI